MSSAGQSSAEVQWKVVPEERATERLHAFSTQNDRYIIIRQDDDNGFKLLEGTKNLDSMKIESFKDKKWNAPSVCLLRPTLVAQNGEDIASFVHPHSYLKDYNYPVGNPRGTVLEWAWCSLPEDNTAAWSRGIPQRAEMDKGEVRLSVGYICFDTPIPSTVDGTASDDTSIKPLRFDTCKLEFSYIIKDERAKEKEEVDDDDDDDDKPERSVWYRGAFTLNKIPFNNDPPILDMFLDDVREKWIEIIAYAKLQLSQINDALLLQAGDDARIIKCLLEDSRQWKKMLSMFEQQLPLVKSLLSPQKNPLLKVSDSIDEPGNERRRLFLHNMEAIKRELLGLQSETKELISLEFNLVSIYEARKSIEMARTSIMMAETSNKIAENSLEIANASLTMSTSMKRLSWITFIFLPLMFATGLFGMNVDLLEGNPSWRWYLVFTIGLMGLVWITWLLFKYFQIELWVENNIGSRLQRAPGSSPISERNRKIYADRHQEKQPLV